MFHYLVIIGVWVQCAATVRCHHQQQALASLLAPHDWAQNIHEWVRKIERVIHLFTLEIYTVKKHWKYSECAVRQKSLVIDAT